MYSIEIHPLRIPLGVLLSSCDSYHHEILKPGKITNDHHLPKWLVEHENSRPVIYVERLWIYKGALSALCQYILLLRNEFGHAKRQMRPAAPRHAHRFGGGFACTFVRVRACARLSVWLFVFACVFVSFPSTLVIPALLSHSFWRRYCVCVFVWVVVYSCPFLCRSSYRHGDLVNFDGTFVFVCVYDCLVVSFLLLLVIRIRRPLFP